MRSSLNPVPWFLIAWLMIAPARADKEVFLTPKLGTNLGVWRLTADPTVRHHANYHNTQCWSPDGRYVCYTRYGGPNAGSEATATVHLYNTHDGSTRQIGQGDSPRWAKRKNWLFYVDYSRSERRRRTLDVVWVDGDRFVDTPRGPYSE